MSRFGGSGLGVAGEVDAGFLDGQGEGWYGLAHRHWIRNGGRGPATRAALRMKASSFVMLGPR